MDIKYKKIQTQKTKYVKSWAEKGWLYVSNYFKPFLSKGPTTKPLSPKRLRIMKQALLMFSHTCWPIRPLTFIQDQETPLQTCVQLILFNGVLNTSPFFKLRVEAPNGVDLVSTGHHSMASPPFLQFGPALSPLVLLCTIPEQHQSHLIPWWAVTTLFRAPFLRCFHFHIIVNDPLTQQLALF